MRSTTDILNQVINTLLNGRQQGSPEYRASLHDGVMRLEELKINYDHYCKMHAIHLDGLVCGFCQHEQAALWTGTLIQEARLFGLEGELQ